MPKSHTLLIALGVACLPVLVRAHEDPWKAAYAKGVQLARTGKWEEARAAFKQAVADRPEDELTGGLKPQPLDATPDPGGRDPYSANFAAAYCMYRHGLELGEDEAKPSFTTAMQELEVLVGKQRASREAFYVLSRCYAKLGRQDLAEAFDTQWKAGVIDWKADNSMLADDDLQKLGIPRMAVTQPPVVTTPPVTTPTLPPVVVPGTPVTQTQTTPKPNQNPVTPPDTQHPTAPSTPGQDDGNGRPRPLDDVKPKPRPKQDSKRTDHKAGQPAPDEGPVQPVPTKFALVIGNSQGAGGGDNAVPFATQSADLVSQSLQTYGGYEKANVTVLHDATAAQISDAAQKIASQVTENGVFFIFFAGATANIGDKDYLAGIDSSGTSDPNGMVGKSELYRLFMAKGARVFAFYETNRSKTSDTGFGDEEAIVGRIAQTYGTVQGSKVYSTVYGGKEVGLFAEGLATTLKEFRSNAIPVQEFAWEVFYNMRRGGDEGTGGGSVQTPTLPVLSNMPPEARF